jgi:hypothetical protein
MLHFLMASESDPDATYSLRARPTDGGVRFACSCPASEDGQCCGHRVALLRGELATLRSANESEVRSLRQLVGATPIVGLVRQIGEVEQELAAAQTRLNHLKRQLAVAMMG